MIRDLKIHPGALEEAEQAVEWYRTRSSRAAALLVRELVRAMDRIAANPNQFPRYVFGTRRTVVRRFPYLIVFREVSDSIEIIAVAHGRRRPGYWRDRTSP